MTTCPTCGTPESFWPVGTIRGGVEWWHDPAVMVPWCEAVGLDPTRVAAGDFVMDHEADGHTHYAAFTVFADPPGVAADGPRERHRMVLTLLPVQCPVHPDFPFVMRTPE